MHDYYVYIISSNTGVLYIGVTNNLVRRLLEHKKRSIKGFTERYYANKLVYYEHHRYILNAIEREKQLKRWSRNKKVKLIKTINPAWEDLGGNIIYEPLKE